MIVYAVVEYYNEYNQYGGYVRGIYKTEESAEKSIHKYGVNHFGRRGYEDSWYELEEMEVNP